MPQPSVTKIHLKITYLKFHLNLPGANGLTYEKLSLVTINDVVWMYECCVFVIDGNNKRLWLYCFCLPIPRSLLLFTPQPSGLEGYCRHGPGGLADSRAVGCQTCGTHISVTAWRIFSVRSFVELSRSVVVHCYGKLPTCPIWACPWAKKLVKFATNWVQTMRNAYLWIHWMDLSQLKFHGLVLTCSCAASYLFARLPHMGLPMGQKFVKSGSTWARLCGTQISETAGWIYTIWSSMEFSRPVGVQNHGHLTLVLVF